MVRGAALRTILGTLYVHFSGHSPLNLCLASTMRDVTLLMNLRYIGNGEVAYSMLVMWSTAYGMPAEDRS